jgi:hypothetical protein
VKGNSKTRSKDCEAVTPRRFPENQAFLLPRPRGGRVCIREFVMAG